jgi:hypothetical protein
MKKIEVGDILFSTFGYEACLARFWKVVGRTAKSLKIAQILDQKHTGNWHAGTSVPVINGNLGPVMVRRKGKKSTKKLISAFEGILWFALIDSFWLVMR